MSARTPWVRSESRTGRTSLLALAVLIGLGWAAAIAAAAGARPADALRSE